MKISNPLIEIEMNITNPSVVKCALLISNPRVGKNEDSKSFSGKMCDFDLKSFSRKI